MPSTTYAPSGPVVVPGPLVTPTQIPPSGTPVVVTTRPEIEPASTGAAEADGGPTVSVSTATTAPAPIAVAPARRAIARRRAPATATTEGVLRPRMRLQLCAGAPVGH